MPTGLMAALVTRLADHLLIRRVVRRTGRSRAPRRSAMVGERAGGDDSIALITTPVGAPPTGGRPERTLINVGRSLSKGWPVPCSVAGPCIAVMGMVPWSADRRA